MMTELLDRGERGDCLEVMEWIKKLATRGFPGEDTPIKHTHIWVDEAKTIPDAGVPNWARVRLPFLPVALSFMVTPPPIEFESRQMSSRLLAKRITKDVKGD